MTIFSEVQSGVVQKMPNKPSGRKETLEFTSKFQAKIKRIILIKDSRKGKFTCEQYVRGDQDQKVKRCEGIGLMWTFLQQILICIKMIYTVPLLDRAK